MAAGTWPKKKRILINRDGRNCYLCKKPLTWRTMTFDHIVPRSEGGSHHTDNLKLACADCNNERGTGWIE